MCRSPGTTGFISPQEGAETRSACAYCWHCGRRNSSEGELHIESESVSVDQGEPCSSISHRIFDLVRAWMGRALRFPSQQTSTQRAVCVLRAEAFRCRQPTRRKRYAIGLT